MRIRALLLAAILSAVAILQPASAAVPTKTKALRDAVTVENIFEHLEAFQAIGDEYGSRASGTDGYDASADYVADLLEAAGYEVKRQAFEFDFFEVLAPTTFALASPTTATYSEGEDFHIMEYSGSGALDDVEVVAVNDNMVPPGAANDSTAGCESSDFGADIEGAIALIQRGTCPFGQKAENAEAAGAVGVIIFNEGQDGRSDVLNGTLGGAGLTIPAIGTTYAVGEQLTNLLRAGELVTVDLFTSTQSETRSTENVIAQTPTGRNDRVVVVGAHLDSVPEGPGINDNGTGSATILEIALQMAELEIEPRNQVRFAFWGAEESGLVGSEYYVSQLSKRQIKNIAVNLNFDMVGSANYVRAVYDGDGSSTPVSGPTGSGTVEDVFVDYFDRRDMASTPTEFSGRSDYGPFIAVGIPAGGLFTGAEEAKTEEEAAIYGGLATFEGDPVSLDPCYHQACDTLDEDDMGEVADLYAALNEAYGEENIVGNVNLLALDEMSDAAAHAVLTFAQTTSDVSGTAKASDKVKADAFEYDGSHLRK